MERYGAPCYYDVNALGYGDMRSLIGSGRTHVFLSVMSEECGTPRGPSCLDEPSESRLSFFRLSFRGLTLLLLLL